MKRFVHVGFTGSFAAERIKEWDAVFDGAADWLRYNGTNWILWTSKTPAEWQGKIQPHLKENERVLILYLDPQNKGGWQHQWVWDWLNKQRLDSYLSDPR